jgi:hypothetical protein
MRCVCPASPDLLLDTPFFLLLYSLSGEGEPSESEANLFRPEPRQLHSLEVTIALKPRQSKLVSEFFREFRDSATRDRFYLFR